MSSSSESDDSSDPETGTDSESTQSNSDSGNEAFSESKRTNSDRALQLISLERSSDLEESVILKLNTEVLDSVLKTCGDKPLYVIAITGQTRSGKSFFIDCIKENLKATEDEDNENWLGKTKSISGFDWKPGYKNNTEGIWIWSRAFIMDAEDKEVAVLLLDTQGFNDELTTPEEISSILGISVLMSSILIVNVTTEIPEECFDWISPFSKYASLCVKKGLEDPFQKLLFLVRDWTMLSDYPLGKESGKKYLRKSLEDRTNLSKQLKKGWDEISCFLLPHIGSSALLKTFTGNPADFSEEFRKRLKTCVELITNEESLQNTKKIWGNEISADEFKGFLQNYVGFMNVKSEMEFGLKPESILNATLEAGGNIKIARGLDVYRQTYNQRKQASLGGYLKSTSIDSMHIQGKSKALDAFNTFSLPNDEEKSFKRKLEQLLELEVEQLKMDNEGARTRKVEDNVSKACNKLRNALQSRFPFTPEKGLNIPENLVFYDENNLEEMVEQMRIAMGTDFLEKFEGEDEEGQRDLKREINSVLQPITDEYIQRNKHNLERAMRYAKAAKEKLKNEYQMEMESLLEKLPTMDSTVLGVFHDRTAKDIEKKFKELSLGTPTYQSKWLDELKEEINEEHQVLELGLESTMAKALQMANEEAQKYKVVLREQVVGMEEDEEINDFHRISSQAILKKFMIANPFGRDSPKGEMIYKKAENLLEAAFTHVVEEGVLKRRKMEEALQNAVEAAINIYKYDMEGTLQEMEFLEEAQFELKSTSLREKAMSLLSNAIDSINLETDITDEAQRKLCAELDESTRFWKNENTQKKALALGQADSELGLALEKYESKMNIAASRLTSHDELKTEHEELRDKIVEHFEGKCNSKNAFLRENYIQKLNQGCEERFSSVEDFFRMATQSKNAGFMTALLACQTEYITNMNQEFKNRDGFFKEEDLTMLHKKTEKTALGKLPTDLSLSDDQTKKLGVQLDKVFQRYKERNALVFRSFQGHEPAIGIDLGTTYCCVAIFLNGRVQVVRNSASGEIIPSYVRINPDGTKVFGTPAKDQAYESPDSTIYDAKRIIGRRMDEESLRSDMTFWPFSVVEEDGVPKIEVHGKKYHPEQISSFLLEHLKSEAEQTLGFDVKKAVITVPAYFTNGQRDATKQAGELAGLEVLAILNEPTAAAVEYRLDCCFDDKERKILVYDLGGGTFDVAVLKMERDNIDVLTHLGDGHLGGEDFDENLMTYCADEFKSKTGFDSFKDKDSLVKTTRDGVRRRLRRLKTVCESGKKALSTAPIHTISIPVYEGAHDLIVEVTKKKFEELNLPMFQKTIDIVDKALLSVNVRKEEIDEVVLVGGSTRIPKLQNMLSSYFNGKALNKKIHPDQAVAKGAAIQAAIKCAKPDEKICDFGAIQEVTPMSLGIEMATHEFDIIIPRGTKIPTTQMQEYATYKENQENAWVRIFEGESPQAKDNKLLADFSLTGIPPNEAGKEVVEVSMHINSNGILSVEALCRSNKGSHHKMTVEEENKGIMTNEVKKRLIQEKMKT